MKAVCFEVFEQVLVRIHQRAWNIQSYALRHKNGCASLDQRSVQPYVFISNSASGRLLGKSHRQGQCTAVASQNILLGSHDLWLRDLSMHSVSWCLAAFCRHCKCITKTCLGVYPAKMCIRTLLVTEPSQPERDTVHVPKHCCVC